MNRFVLKRQYFWIAAIVTLVLVILYFVPIAANVRQGSTYSRAPSGYGAWYASVQAQGIPIQRWQKPLEQWGQSGQAAPVTLLQIYNGVEPLSLSSLPNQDWVKQGNVLVLLGVRDPVTEAPFRSILDSPVGGVKIATRRRHPTTSGVIKTHLSDRFGAVVWEEALDKGRIILATTPHLGANAYQDEPGNFAFLTQLLTATGHPLWVDEYLHGYKDLEAIAPASSQNLFRYLAGTPLLLVGVQAGVLLLVVIWGQNRLGSPRSLPAAITDNSEAYMQALAGVLLKANCSEFVVEMVGKAEQLHVQRSLGLGTDPVAVSVLLATWTQQTGKPLADLESVLRLATQPRRLSQGEMQVWLDCIQRVRQSLPDPYLPKSLSRPLTAAISPRE